MGALEGRVAIVTGGADGIGRATAQKLANEGAAVVVTDINGPTGKEVVEALVASGRKAIFIEQDVAVETSWPKVIAAAKQTFGAVHVLVNNAGIGGWADVETETMESYQRVIAVTQTGMWLGMKFAGPAIRESGGGSIVNISSIFGASGGFGTNLSYHAAKGAVRLMTKNAALHWALDGVRVNSVHPGFIATAGVKEFASTPAGQAMIDLTPMGRLGTPEEIAEVVSFLASDASAFMTGSELYADGGYMAR